MSFFSSRFGFGLFLNLFGNNYTILPGLVIQVVPLRNHAIGCARSFALLKQQHGFIAPQMRSPPTNGLLRSLIKLGYEMVFQNGKKTSAYFNLTLKCFIYLAALVLNITFNSFFLLHCLPLVFG